MASQKQNDVIKYLNFMLSDDYTQDAHKFECEIGLERYNPIIEYLASINLLEIIKFQSGKYRTHLINELDKQYIHELIRRLEKQETII